MSDITQERLKELLCYCPETGVFTWLKTSSTRVKPGMVAGSVLRGYVRIDIGGKRYPAHRLAWMYVYGRFPDTQIDHINGIKGDNRIANLRPATNAENQQNVGLKRNNTSGIIGVHMDPRGRKKQWVASIKVNGRTKTLGYFSSAEEAIAARQSAEKQYHPFRNAARAALGGGDER